MLDQPKTFLSRAVNIPGDLIATSASQKGGVITLGGAGGSIVVAGNLSAKENSNINISGDFRLFRWNSRCVRC